LTPGGRRVPLTRAVESKRDPLSRHSWPCALGTHTVTESMQVPSRLSVAS
jgi:hypothetical protein